MVWIREKVNARKAEVRGYFNYQKMESALGWWPQGWRADGSRDYLGDKLEGMWRLHVGFQRDRERLLQK